MFFGQVYCDFFDCCHKCHNIECFESSDLQIECFESQILVSHLTAVWLNFELQHFPVRQLSGNFREFTHPNSSFEYVSDFSNFVFGDVVLFSKCLSHDFFTFLFAFCYFLSHSSFFLLIAPLTSNLYSFFCEVGRICICNIQSFADFFCFFCQARPSFFSLFIVDFVCQGSPFQASYVKDKH